ncbi:MAG: hypothetical protein LC797_12120, partial [Chloroflexi bacterium]|nr:hypothetical protein [Chloroflexota bacterium]
THLARRPTGDDNLEFAITTVGDLTRRPEDHDYQDLLSRYSQRAAARRLAAACRYGFRVGAGVGASTEIAVAVATATRAGLPIG